MFELLTTSASIEQTFENGVQRISDVETPHYATDWPLAASPLVPLSPGTQFGLRWPVLTTQAPSARLDLCSHDAWTSTSMASRRPAFPFPQSPICLPPSPSVQTAVGNSLRPSIEPHRPQSVSSAFEQPDQAAYYSWPVSHIHFSLCCFFIILITFCTCLIGAKN